MKLDEYKKVAIQAAEHSGEIIKKYFRSPLAVETKQDDSPVTQADQQAEEIIRKTIIRSYPSHGIIGEEFEALNPGAEFQWVIDPIDGTKSFISGFFDFGTIIGLMYQNKPILGLVHQPVLREMLIGDNQITLFNGKAVRVRQCIDLSQATLLTTDLETLPDKQHFNKLAQQVKQCRTWGNCYGHVLVAMGYADVMVDPVMKLWDIVGIMPIIKGAGGIVSDYQGEEPLFKSSLVSCATQQLQQQVINYLNRKL